MCRRDAKQCNDDVLLGRFLGRFKGPSESQARTWCSSRTCNKQTPRLSFAFQSEQRESGHTYNKLVSCLVTWEAFKTRQFKQCSLDQLGNQSQQNSPRMMSIILKAPLICYRAHLHVAPLFGRPGTTRGGERVVDGLARLFWNRLQSHNC